MVEPGARLLTARETMKMLRIGKNRLAALERSRELIPIRPGKRRRLYDVSDINLYLERRKQWRNEQRRRPTPSSGAAGITRTSQSAVVDFVARSTRKTRPRRR